MLFLAMCLLFAEPSMSDQVAKMRSDFAALENWFHEELVAAKHDAKKVIPKRMRYTGRNGKRWQRT